MEMKDEGPAFPPVPLVRNRTGERTDRRRRAVLEDTRCEMCGAPVITTHCKRICLKCGFMTGCSEGI